MTIPAAPQSGKIESGFITACSVFLPQNINPLILLKNSETLHWQAQRAIQICPWQLLCTGGVGGFPMGSHWMECNPNGSHNESHCNAPSPPKWVQLYCTESPPMGPTGSQPFPFIPGLPVTQPLRMSLLTDKPPHYSMKKPIVRL